ncbi:14205_t:CDS:2, partial [Cetraspora pellucida]
YEKYPTADNIFIKGCAYNQPANQINLFTEFTIQANYNKLEIISKMQLYDSEVQTLTSLFFGLKKEKLVINFFENSSNYAKYTNSVSRTTFLHAIATVIEESVLEETRKSSVWSLLIDENNTITHNKTCAIVNKHVTNNIFVLQYLGLIELKEVDAIGIINNLIKFFLAKILEPSKLLHFESNGDTFSNIHQELNKTIHFITIEFIRYPDKNIEPTLGTHLHDYCIQYS